MRKYFLLVLAGLLNVSMLFAQETTKLNYTLVKKIVSATDPNRPAALFVQGDVNVIRLLTNHLGGKFKYSAGDVAAIVLPISKVETLAADPNVIRIEDNYMKLQPLNDSMVVKNRIVDVHAGVAPLPQGYDGTNVVMGIIDSGIDFTHGDFEDSLGNTRVKFIWDHNLTGNAPQPYNYGREFNSFNIDNGQATAHVDNYFGHGTHVSGVAAGNGLMVGLFGGAAPKADIITVCVNWNLPDDDWLNSVADAVEYIFTKADSMGKPCVINISAGTYYGSHDAKDLQAVMIDNLITAQNGRIVVCAAGNEGDSKLHVKHTVASPDTFFTWFGLNPNPIYMEMWGGQTTFAAMKFTVAVDKVSPYYEYRGMLPYSQVASHLGILKTDTLKNSAGQRLALVQSYAYFQAGRYSMIFYVIADSTSGYYYRLMNTGTGTMDLWSFQMITSGLPTAATFPDITKYVMPDTTQNIVSSFSCSDKVITVGNYINKSEYEACDSTLTVTGGIPGDLAANSSRGPTRDGRLKPEITASGSVTLAPLVIANIAGIPVPKITKQGCLHMRDGGTSTSSPVVAGIAALYFQRYPNATWLQAKQAITICSYTDSYVWGPLPNNTWGHGKVDGFAALTGCLALGLNEGELQSENNFFASPNPFTDQTIIHYNLSEPGLDNVSLKIFDVMGKEVKRIAIENNKGEILIQKKDMEAGVYFISLLSGNVELETLKLVVF